MKNKIIKTLLSVMMVFGSALPVFAEETTTKGRVTGNELPITKFVVTSTEGQVLPDTTWNFTVTPVDVGTNPAQVDGYELYSGVALANSNVSLTVTGGTTAKNTDWENKDVIGLKGSATVTFSDNLFTKAGVYRYEVKETAGTDSVVTYDSRTYTVDVYVNYAANDDGEYTNNLKVQYIKSYIGSVKQPIEFKNTIKNGDLSVSKTVTGNQGDKSKSFDFEIAITANDWLKAGSKVAYTLSDGTTGYLTAGVDNASSNVLQLKHGDSFTLTGMPYNTPVTVKEINMDGLHYTTKVSKDGAEATTTTEASATIGETKHTFAYENYKEGLVPTGVNLNSTPFVSMLIIALTAGILFLSMKNKTSEK